MKKFFIVAAVLFGIAAVFLLTRASDDQSPESEPASKSAKSSPASKSAALIIGDDKAKLTLVEYGDFQCPRCNRFFHEIEPSIRQDFVEKGLVKIEWRNFATIGQESVDAAQASHCANDQRFFPQFYAAVFNHMDKNYWSKNLNGENVGALSKSNLKKLAGQSYDLINQKEFNKCLDSGKHIKTVEAELAAAEAAGYSLNTYVVGRQVIQGVQPYSIFKPVIQSQL